MSNALPYGACDAHCHVFGPASRFAFAPGRSYTPDDAPKEALMALHARMGIDRAVIVQPVAHGFDNRVTLDAIAASGGRYRGVALVPANVTAPDVEALHAAGIRGVRFNFLPHLSAPPAPAAFRQIAALIAPLGWHIVLHVEVQNLPLVKTYLPGLELPVVIDHMARIRTDATPDHFHTLLALAHDARIWIKLSGADRASAHGAPYDDALPFMRALADAAPGRMLWGSDWPHPNIQGPLPDEIMLLDLLHRAFPQPSLLSRIMVDNPARLYGFS